MPIFKFDFDQEQIQFQGAITPLTRPYLQLMLQIQHTQTVMRNLWVYQIIQKYKITQQSIFMSVLMIFSLLEGILLQVPFSYSFTDYTGIFAYSYLYVPAFMFYRILTLQILPVSPSIQFTITIVLAIILSVLALTQTVFLTKYLAIVPLTLSAIWTLLDYIKIYLSSATVTKLQCISMILLYLGHKIITSLLSLKTQPFIYSLLQNFLVSVILTLMWLGSYMIKQIYNIPYDSVLNQLKELTEDLYMDQAAQQNSGLEQCKSQLLICHISTQCVYFFATLALSILIYYYNKSYNYLSVLYIIIVLASALMTIIVIFLIKILSQSSLKAKTSKIILGLIPVLGLIPPIIAIGLKSFLSQMQLFSLLGFLVLPIVICSRQIPQTFRSVEDIVILSVLLNIIIFSYPYIFVYGSLMQNSYMYLSWLFCMGCLIVWIIFCTAYNIIKGLYKMKVEFQSIEILKGELLKQMQNLPELAITFNIIYFLMIECTLIFLISYLPNLTDRMLYYYYSLLFETLYLYICFWLINLASFDTGFCRCIFGGVALFLYSVLGLIVFGLKYSTFELCFPVFIQIGLTYLIFEFGVHFKTSSKNYQEAKKLLILNAVYFFLYVPFFIVIPIGYIFSSNRNDFYYNSVTVGLIYISVVVTLIGLAVHLILNLTQSNLKQLFILKQANEWMDLMNFKHDDDKILAIATIFEEQKLQVNKLFSILQEEKFIKIQILPDAEIKQDYQFIEPAQHRPIKQLRKHKKTTLKVIQLKEQADSAAESDDHLSVAPIIVAAGSNLGVFSRIQLRSIDAKQYANAKGSVEYDLFAVNYERCVRFLCRIFYVLSEPQEFITLQLFEQFLKAMKLCKQMQVEQSQIPDLFNQFSRVQQMEMTGFKDFIVHVCKVLYGQSSQKYVPDLVRDHLFFKIYFADETVKYLLFRKQLNFGKHEQIWKFQFIQRERQRYFNKLKSQRLKKQHETGQLKDNLNKLKNSMMQSKNMESTNASPQQVQIAQIQQISPIIQKKLKNIEFKSSATMYLSLARKLVEVYDEFEKRKNQLQGLEQFNLRSLGNIIAIGTKVSDFLTSFLWIPFYTFYLYYSGQTQLISPTTFPLYYLYIYVIVVTSVGIYFVLLAYHENDFRSGSLGLDQFKQQLSLTNINYYTTKLLFIFGSTAASPILNNFIGLLLCYTNDNSNFYLYADSTVTCFTIEHLSLMITAIIVFASYYPLAVIVFPYSSSIDRSKQIKYKSEFQVFYLQSKFLLGILIVLLSTKPQRTKLIIINFVVSSICAALLIMFYKMNPCSVKSISRVQIHFYFVCVWVSLCAAFCYYFSYVVCGITALVGILIYALLMVFKNWNNSQKIYQIDDRFQSIIDNIKNKQKRTKQSMQIEKGRA